MIHMHLSVDLCFAAFQMVYQDKAGAVEVTEFFGRDETLAHLSFACAEMLSARAPGNSKRVAAFAQLLAIYIAEKSKKSAPLFRKNTTGVARSPEQTLPRGVNSQLVTNNELSISKIVFGHPIGKWFSRIR